MQFAGNCYNCLGLLEVRASVHPPLGLSRFIEFTVDSAVTLTKSQRKMHCVAVGQETITGSLRKVSKPIYSLVSYNTALKII